MEEEIQTPENGTEDEKENLTNQPESETPDSEEQESKSEQPAPREEVDYKTKFSESTRENQILQGKLNQYESRRELTNQPTETELRAAFPTWDLMSEEAKELAKSNLTTRKMAEEALADKRQREADAKWNRELDIAIASNPDLAGQEQQFKEYASKPSHRGAPADVLVAAFLHKSTSTPTPKSTPGSVLERGSGGPKDSVKPHKYSTEEMAEIRKTDYKRYMDIIRSGQFEEDI